MATPAMLRQNVSATMAYDNAGSVRINTFNANGTVLNVASGYTLLSCRALPTNNYNPLFSPIDLTGDISVAFDATGITVSWTVAQAATILGLLQTLQNNADVSISNDSGTTSSTAGRINLSVDVISTALD